MAAARRKVPVVLLNGFDFMEWEGVDDDTMYNAISRTGTWSSSSTNYGTAIHFGSDEATKTLTLPAAGSRNYTSGTLGYRGSDGFYWSSTENGSAAYTLNFYSSNVYPAHNYFRTHGFSVRCIAE